MTTNVWTEETKPLYVVAGYWISGYVVDEPNSWTDVSQPFGSWNAVSQTNNTWTTIG